MGNHLLVERAVRTKLDAYEDEYELWKADHDLAMRYFDFCDHVAEGIKLYRGICRLDEHWREEVLSKRLEHDPDFTGRISELFTKVSRLMRQTRDTLLPEFERQFAVVDKADEFRACCKELEDIHTSDADFFNHDALVDLRDAALDEVG